MQFVIRQPKFKGLWHIFIINPDGFPVAKFMRGFDKKHQAKLALIQLKADLKRLCEK